MKMFFFLSLVAITNAGSVLRTCENTATTGQHVLYDVNINNNIYLYVNPTGPDGEIKVMLKDGNSVLLRIVIYCNSNKAKVSYKPKNTWKKLVSDATVFCDTEKMPIVINNKKKEIWVGEGSYTPLAYSTRLAGTGTLTVSGDVTVDSMAAGSSCIHYPSADLSCPEAYQWYATHTSCASVETGSSLVKNGFLDCNHVPICNGDAYSFVQPTAGNMLSCSTLGGDLVGDPFSGNDVSDAWDYCTSIVPEESLGSWDNMPNTLIF